MSHEVGKKKTRKQKMENTRSETIHNDEIKKHTTQGVIEGER